MEVNIIISKNDDIKLLKHFAKKNKGKLILTQQSDYFYSFFFSFINKNDLDNFAVKANSMDVDDIIIKL